MAQKPDERLKHAASIFAGRSVLYGDNYLRHGLVIAALFPEGVKLQSTDEHNRFGLLTQVVAKLTRYCENWECGGHEDSLDDLSVYAQMLAYVDARAAESNAANIHEAFEDFIQSLEPTKSPFIAKVTETGAIDGLFDDLGR